MTQEKIRTELANRVLEALKKDSPPWRSKHNRGYPANPKTGQKYTGINPLILDAIADKYNYRSKYWATYHQWHQLDQKVAKRKDKIPQIDWGANIVNWQPFQKIVDKGDILSMERFHLLQTYPVFNADQCFGKDTGKYLILKENTQEPDYAQAEAVVKATKARIIHQWRAKKPYYDREKDYIVLPSKGRWVDGGLLLEGTKLEKNTLSNPGLYWASVFHELSHYSEKRIGWYSSDDQNELMAEIVSGHMESLLDLPHDCNMIHHNKWVKTWIEKIEKNPTYLFDATAYASRSVDWILGFSRTTSPDKP